MSLSVEVFQKIRLLLDKPVSPLVKNQIIQLINKQVVPADDLLSLFTRKYRADLIIYVLNAHHVTLDKMQSTLAVVVSKLLQFKMEDAVSMWKNILSRQGLRNLRQLWTEKLFQQSLKNTNQLLKSAQLTLLKQNCKLLWEWGEGRIFEQLTKNYCRSLIKFNIYLPEYPQLLSLLVSKAEGAKTDLIDSELRKELIIRLIQFLNSTRNRQCFSFQNQCLKALCLLLKSEKAKMNDLLIVHLGEKAIEDYLWKKPTREEAYRCKQALKKVEQTIKKENQEKMQRNYQSNAYKPQEPLLIEEVINKANQYRKNNHLMIDEKSIANIQRSTFLKKGKGNGGGKSAIISPKKQLKDTSELDRLDQLVESCFKQSASTPFVQHKQEQQPYNYSLGASTITIQEDQQFCEISNLIDLAYKFKFGHDSSY